MVIILFFLLLGLKRCRRRRDPRPPKATWARSSAPCPSPHQYVSTAETDRGRCNSPSNPPNSTSPPPSDRRPAGLGNRPPGTTQLLPKSRDAGSARSSSHGQLGTASWTRLHSICRADSLHRQLLGNGGDTASPPLPSTTTAPHPETTSIYSKLMPPSSIGSWKDYVDIFTLYRVQQTSEARPVVG